ncbi:protein of unknown function [Micropruina glycogenica]|uniref:Uncharacterized protein n=1 Tax=Micropruina glycogenica TaxID=75385 RepID=A0A2N9JIR0_9ACTN|nr:protein of unknown function [Micropruina glycogenica]
MPHTCRRHPTAGSGLRGENTMAHLPRHGSCVSAGVVLMRPRCRHRFAKARLSPLCAPTHVSTFYGLGWTMTSVDWLTGMTVTG